MAAHAAFGRLPGVERPALATIIPTRDRPAILLDSGATVECRPQHLLQFAIMGSVYALIGIGFVAVAATSYLLSADEGLGGLGVAGSPDACAAEGSRWFLERLRAVR